MLETLSPYFFWVVSGIAATFNAFFLIRTMRNYTALRAARSTDVVLHRISRGFILIWAFIVLDDLIRVVSGIGVVIHQPAIAEALLLAPLGSLTVAIIGLRSFR